METSSQSFDLLYRKLFRIRDIVSEKGLRSIAGKMEKELRLSINWAFANETDPVFGVKWRKRAPVVPDEKSRFSRRRQQSKKMLQDTGQMRRSLRISTVFSKSSATVLVQSSLLRTFVHQNGTFDYFIHPIKDVVRPIHKKALWWPGVKGIVRSVRGHKVRAWDRPFAGMRPQGVTAVRRFIQGQLT